MISVIDCFVNFYSRGAGCIFVEMISGLALFPGIKDNVDQLNKIWQVYYTIQHSHYTMQ